MAEKRKAIITVGENLVMGSEEYQIVVPPGYCGVRVTSDVKNTLFTGFTLLCPKLGWRWTLFRFVAKLLIGVEYPKGDDKGSYGFQIDNVNNPLPEFSVKEAVS